MIKVCFRFFSIAYFLLFLIVFAVFIYLDSYSNICSITPKDGVKCPSDVWTKILGYVHQWFVIMTTYTANMIVGIKVSALNFKESSTIINMVTVITCWIPFIYGGGALIKSIYTKLFGMVR